MAFRFELKEVLPKYPLPPALPVPDDYGSPSRNALEYLHSDACALIAMTSRFAFAVNGFGDTSWPLDIATDMESFVEECDEVVCHLDIIGQTSLIVFHEGIDRSLSFRVLSAQVIEIECQSWVDSNWQPSPAIEPIEVEQLQHLFYNFVNAYAQQVQAHAPLVFINPTFEAWLTKISSCLRFHCTDIAN